jgi:transposase-like protein
MSQHFLLSRPAKTLTLAQVMRMSNEEAETAFARIRWDSTNGQPVCPHCGSMAAFNVRRPKGPRRWCCKACGKEFTTTSGTLFAWHNRRVSNGAQVQHTVKLALACRPSPDSCGYWQRHKEPG